jgi:hypothetical protein
MGRDFHSVNPKIDFFKKCLANTDCFHHYPVINDVALDIGAESFNRSYHVDIGIEGPIFV